MKRFHFLDGITNSLKLLSSSKNITICCVMLGSSEIKCEYFVYLMSTHENRVRRSIQLNGGGNYMLVCHSEIIY